MSGKISSYPLVGTVALNDVLLGDQTTGGPTTSRFPVSAVMNTMLMTCSYKADVYCNITQGVTAATWTKAQLNTKNYDTGSNFDAITNYRFTIPITGFYIVSYSIALSTSGMATGFAEGALYKNGAAIIMGGRSDAIGNANDIPRDSGSRLLSLTAGDYLEVWGYIVESGRSFEGANDRTFMTVGLFSYQ